MDSDNRFYSSTPLLPVEPAQRRAEFALWVLVLGTALAMAIATLLLE